MKYLTILFLLCSLAFAAETDSLKTISVADSLQPKSDSLVSVSSDSLESNEKKDSVTSELEQEIALRDSLLASGDSIRAYEQKLHQTELDVQNARCENWEQSYNTLKKEHDTCVKILRVNLTNGEEKQKQMRRMGTIAQMGSWVGGILIGLALGIWVF